MRKWLPQTDWLCVHSPQNLCHFLLSSRLVKPSESAPFSHRGIYRRAQGFSALQGNLAHVVINENEPSLSKSENLPQ